MLSSRISSTTFFADILRRYLIPFSAIKLYSLFSVHVSPAAVLMSLIFKILTIYAALSVGYERANFLTSSIRALSFDVAMVPHLARPCAFVIILVVAGCRNSPAAVAVLGHHDWVVVAVTGCIVVVAVVVVAVVSAVVAMAQSKKLKCCLCPLGLAHRLG